MKGTAPSIVIASLFLSMFAFAFTALPAKALSGIIYISPNGSISSPVPANITTHDKVTYTFTGNNYLPIVVNRSNIIIDGKHHTLQVSGNDGFYLSSVDEVTIKNTIITNSLYGIYLWNSSFNNLSGNDITGNWVGIDLEINSDTNILSGNHVAANRGNGIYLDNSNFTTLSGNNITANAVGVWLEGSDSRFNSLLANNIKANGVGIYLNGVRINFLYNNSITTNSVGIYLHSSADNLICHNNFSNNTQQTSILSSSYNNWDNEYPVALYTFFPTGGNYWNDYKTRYPNATQIDSSSIWNTPYVIDANNTDHYPLMSPVKASKEPPLTWFVPVLIIIVVAAGSTLLAVILYGKKRTSLARAAQLGSPAGEGSSSFSQRGTKNRYSAPNALAHGHFGANP